jgi:hypothetical protein
LEIEYKTRDGKGNDIVKLVKIKEYPVENVEFDCPICNQSKKEGVKAKKIISSNFTDYAYIGEYICPECSKLFSLYFYNYIVDCNGIRLINVRELKDELCKRQNPPFRFIITTSQKKHLFYRSQVNYSADRYAVNLETEVIYTTPDRMKQLFGFVESLITLGASKTALSNGEIPFAVMQKLGFSLGEKVLSILNSELQKSREIQIPLYCGQKLKKTEEECLCSLDLLLNQQNEERQR